MKLKESLEGESELLLTRALETEFARHVPLKEFREEHRMLSLRAEQWNYSLQRGKRFWIQTVGEPRLKEDNPWLGFVLICAEELGALG
jgi:hypothetical protein